MMEPLNCDVIKETLASIGVSTLLYKYYILEFYKYKYLL